MDKDKQVTVSNWASPSLNEDQVEYAAMDAWITLRLYWAMLVPTTTPGSTAAPPPVNPLRVYRRSGSSQQLLARTSMDIVNIQAAALLGLLVGSRVPFALYSCRRSMCATNDEPLLTA
eukprot:gnl/TRDRNA2_/TRDRNA2_136788_c0_seq1.p1 gnl/TRDRNA2_/TRDRNA2_136788_c0~~gnl/TRDRNA2_/TRDRNA2_136788_c0_seq1.p1  ORF type:complete len:118 (-),score=13.31 gnl/TRDRNA2_/TRDRNA2_136788_c0_seq1:42-395(-)